MNFVIFLASSVGKHFIIAESSSCLVTYVVHYLDEVFASTLSDICELHKRLRFEIPFSGNSYSDHNRLF